MAQAEPTEPSFSIFVRVDLRSHVVYELEPSFCVEVLLRKVEGLRRKARSDESLQYCGRVLNLAHTLRECDLMKDAEVQLVPRGRGGVDPAKVRRDVAAGKERSPSSVSKLRAEVAKASSPAAALSSPAEASSSSHTAEGGKRNARMAAVGHTVVAAVGVSNALLEPLVKKLLSVKASRIESQK